MVNYFLFRNNNIILTKLIIKNLNFQSKYNRLFLGKVLVVPIIQDVFLSQITPPTNNGTWCLFSICPFLYHSHQTITIKFHNIFLLLLFYTTYLFHPPNFLSILSILLSYPTYLIHPPTGIRNITHTWRTHVWISNSYATLPCGICATLPLRTLRVELGAITSILYIVILLRFIFLYEARWTNVKT